MCAEMNCYMREQSETDEPSEREREAERCVVLFCVFVVCVDRPLGFIPSLWILSMPESPPNFTVMALLRAAESHPSSSPASFLFFFFCKLTIMETSLLYSILIYKTQR